MERLGGDGCSAVLVLATHPLATRMSVLLKHASIFFTRWNVINAVTFVHLFYTMKYSNDIIWIHSFIQ